MNVLKDPLVHAVPLDSVRSENVEPTEGFELRMAVNHLGHALLMSLLAPVMTPTTSPDGSKPRIVSLSSKGHKFVPECGIEFDHLRSNPAHQTPVKMYCQAKLAQVLWVRSFAARFPGITAVAINPGDVNTGLYKDTQGPWFFGIVKFLLPLFAKSLEQGAFNSLWAATAAEGQGPMQVTSGEFYDPVGKKGADSVLSRDPKLVKTLEQWTDEAIKEFL